MDVSNRGENQQRYRRRTRKSVNNASSRAVEDNWYTAPSKGAIQACQRGVVVLNGDGIV